MKINWHSDSSTDQKDLESQIDFEYKFRKKLSQFILKYEELECCEEELDSLVFDYDTKTKVINISEKTPETVFLKLNKIWLDFLEFYKS